MPSAAFRVNGSAGARGLRPPAVSSDSLFNGIGHVGLLDRRQKCTTAFRNTLNHGQLAFPVFLPVELHVVPLSSDEVLTSLFSEEKGQVRRGREQRVEDR